MGELVDEEVTKLANGIEGAKILNTDLQTAASAVANRISQVAIGATNAETLVSLSKALAELNSSFFPQTNQLPGANGAAPSSFEKHLRD